MHLNKSDNVLLGSGMEGLLLGSLFDYTPGRNTDIFMESSCGESWGQINIGNFAPAYAQKTKTFRIPQSEFYEVDMKEKADKGVCASASTCLLQQWLVQGYCRNIRCIYEYNIKASA